MTTRIGRITPLAVLAMALASCQSQRVNSLSSELDVQPPKASLSGGVGGPVLSDVFELRNKGAGRTNLRWQSDPAHPGFSFVPYQGDALPASLDGNGITWFRVVHQGADRETEDAAQLRIEGDANVVNVEVSVHVHCPADHCYDGRCFDFASDPGNCGACGHVCTEGISCVRGVCCAPETDAQLCEQRPANTCGAVTVTDRCGQERALTCDRCQAPDVCVNNRCACEAESDEQLCDQQPANTCGAITVTDRCGDARAISCDRCESPDTCGGGGEEGVCGCTGDSDATLCANAGYDCGTPNTVDNCGQARQVSCGACPSTQTCSAHQCVCRAETDAEFCAGRSASCGSITGRDRCGTLRTVTCGTCDASESCVSNQCLCEPESDGAICARQDRNACGTFHDYDNCGAWRTVTCDPCSAPQTCGGGGTPGVCGCRAQTDAELCSIYGLQCGVVTVADGCGTLRSINCGVCCPFTVTLDAPVDSLLFWGVDGLLQQISSPIVGHAYPSPAGACAANVEYPGRWNSWLAGTFPSGAPAAHAELTYPGRGTVEFCVLPVERANWGVAHNGDCCSSATSCSGRVCSPGTLTCSDGWQSTCNSAGTGRTTARCPTGLCADSARCATCQPGQPRCHDGVQYVCNQTGSGEIPSSCATGTCADDLSCGR